MGEKMKGAYSSRRRWMNVYIVMAIVCVCVCGILGVMGLQRIKQTNMLNLLIKQKRHQIQSLHHLLQKEREQMQEEKKKTEEMKMKIFNLGAQKSELVNRVLETQSTLSSLRDEQRTIELAFQEKQNEAKLFRNQYMEIKSLKPQVEALTEVLHQKEAEIAVLKHRLQLNEANKIGSTSMDKLSILPVNVSNEEHGRNETIRKEQVDKLENSQEITSEKNKDLEMHENSDKGQYKFRGKHKHVYLKRAKGKIWGRMDKQTQGFNIQNSTRLQNESVSKNNQTEKDDKLPDVSKPEQDAGETSHRVAKFDESFRKKLWQRTTLANVIIN